MEAFFAPEPCEMAMAMPYFACRAPEPDEVKMPFFALRAPELHEVPMPYIAFSEPSRPRAPDGPLVRMTRLAPPLQYRLLPWRVPPAIAPEAADRIYVAEMARRRREARHQAMLHPP